MCLPTIPGAALQEPPAADAPAPAAEGNDTGVVWLRDLAAPPAADGAADADQLFLPLENGELMSLDRDTGATVWSEPRQTRWPPYLRNDSLLVASEAAILELNPATGAERGAVPLTAPPAGPLAGFERGVVLSLTSGVVLAFDAAGRLLWTARTGDVSRVPAAADEGRVYVALSDGRLTALRGDDGFVLWTRDIGGTLSAPTARDGRVYVGSSTRAVYAFDGSTGRLLWEYATGGDVVGTTADAASLYVVALDNVVRALHLSRGSLKWKRVPPTRPISTPVRSGSRLLMGGVRPQLLAFEARTGEPAISFALPSEFDLAMLAAAPIVFPEAPEAVVSAALVTRDTRILGVRLDPRPPATDSPVEPAAQP